MSLIVALYNEINHRVLNGGTGLPAGCELRDPPLANLDDDAPVSQWARGFLIGHTWLAEDWEDALPDDLEEELAAMLFVLTFFASRSLAERFAAEIAKEDATLETMAGTVVRMLPCSIAAYAEAGRALYEATLSFESEEPAWEPELHGTGRNDPCPCGSGRKFKKCCGKATN